MKLELTLDEINLLNAALGKLPLEQSIGLWMKIREQVLPQMKRAEEPSKEE